MLAPRGAALRLVVYSRKEVELVDRYLFRLDTQLVTQLTLCSLLDSLDSFR